MAMRMPNQLSSCHFKAEVELPDRKTKLFQSLTRTREDRHPRFGKSSGRAIDFHRRNASNQPKYRNIRGERTSYEVLTGAPAEVPNWRLTYLHTNVCDCDRIGVLWGVIFGFSLDTLCERNYFHIPKMRNNCTRMGLFGRYACEKVNMMGRITIAKDASSIGDATVRVCL